MSEVSEQLKKVKELVDEVYTLRKKSQEAEKKFKEAKSELSTIMENAEIDKMIGDDCSATLNLKSSVTVPKDNLNKQRVFDYIKREHGEDVLFSMLTINARTFSSFYDKEVEAKIIDGDLEFKIEGVSPYDYYSLDLRAKPKRKV